MHQPTDIHLESHNANKLDLNERRLMDLMSQNSIRLAQARHAAGKHADCDEWAICSTPAGWERCRCVFCHREAAVAHIPLAYGRRLHVEVGSSGDVTV